MRIAVLGTGAVGQALSRRFAELGHEVLVGTRDPAATRDRTAWQDLPAGMRLATFADAASAAEVVVNASGGDVSLAVLESAGADSLAGKVLLDVANPLDHSQGFPPRLFVKDDDSLAEQIQRAHPEARVVKTLNTLNNQVMVRAAELGEVTTVFVSGDDPEAKQLATRLLEELGHGDVLDLGDLSSARGAEMFLPLWIRIRMALGTSDFNIRVVR